MKVCTDACILGACADVAVTNLNILTGLQNPPIRILDIGTGTGLLALMVAQRNATAIVDAVEIDDAAFRQAMENVVASPFGERIHLYHGRIQDFQAAPYDRIVTNPPFYSNHLRSPDAAVNRALHTGELSFEELIAAVVRLMQPSGQWWVLLPPYEAEKLITMAAGNGLFPFSRLLIRHQAQKAVFRIVTAYSFDKLPLTDQELSIYAPDGRTYTAEFRALLRDFYLIF